ncbi:MAG: glutathione S-transferase family protein [Spongiibacteraceae bacterium]
MSLKLYAHPFSSYSQKVLIALYENNTPFEFQQINHDDPKILTELEALWPFKRFPVLVDGDRALIESTVILEYLDQHYPGKTRLIPADADAALEARFMDRFFDNDIMAPAQKFVADALRPADKRDPYGVEQAKRQLDIAYAWLDSKLVGREWAIGAQFTIADCAASPSLFYADWVHRIPEKFANVIAYRKRLLARPSFARAVDEARYFRPFFPLGAPDRD